MGEIDKTYISFLQWETDGFSCFFFCRKNMSFTVHFLYPSKLKSIRYDHGISSSCVFPFPIEFEIHIFCD